MATNYDKVGTKLTGHNFTTEFLNPNGVLEAQVVTQILKGLGAKIALPDNPLASTDVTADSFVVGGNLKGVPVVDITGGGSIDLSSLTARQAAGVAAVKDFLFLGDAPVNVKLGPDADTNGKFALNFNGNVVTQGGDDIIDIRSKGNVYVASGDGNDTITTGSGLDTVVAGKGDDSISTGKGNDSISTGIGNDTVDAGAGNDKIYVGGASGDVKVIAAGAGNDVVKLALGYTGNATIDGDGGESAGLVKATDKDTLDLRYVQIKDVVQDGAQADHLTITLNDGSVLDVQHFEKFVYDISTADFDGGGSSDPASGVNKAIKLTGLDLFLAQFHHSS